jgi:hypothetical protein
MHSQIVNSGYVRIRSTALLTRELDLMDFVNCETMQHKLIAAFGQHLESIDTVELRPNKRTSYSLRKATACPPASIRIETTKGRAIRSPDWRAR